MKRGFIAAFQISLTFPTLRAKVMDLVDKLFSLLRDMRDQTWYGARSAHDERLRQQLHMLLKLLRQQWAE